MCFTQSNNSKIEYGRRNCWSYPRGLRGPRGDSVGCGSLSNFPTHFVVVSEAVAIPSSNVAKHQAQMSFRVSLDRQPHSRPTTGLVAGSLSGEPKCSVPRQAHTGNLESHAQEARDPGEEVKPLKDGSSTVTNLRHEVAPERRSGKRTTSDLSHLREFFTFLNF